MPPVDLNESYPFDEMEVDNEAEELVRTTTLPNHKSPTTMTSLATPPQTEEERQRREEEESIELARRLMAEEAMASYQNSFQLLNQQSLSDEDRAALQAAIQEDERDAVQEQVPEDEDGNLSYDTLLNLAERIGDVKTERWAMRAPTEIEKIPVFSYIEPQQEPQDDSECKCLVCQCEYNEEDQLRRLPCNHCFHADCAKQWLMVKDFCPYCRQSIV